MAELTLVKATKAERATNTRTEALLITPALVRGWENPPFQRPLRVNSKVTALAEVIKNTCVIPGIVTLGILKGKTYLLDGQHRRQAFLIADIPEGYVEVRMHWFESMPEMGAEFVQLNSALVRLRPDDILRGLEGSLESIQIIRKRCPFVGYDFVRRGDHAPVVSMSLIIRCWDASQNETPQPSGAGGTTSAQSRASSMTKDEASRCSDFLVAAFNAWERDVEYQRLWGALNLTLCAWLYRRLVLQPWSAKSPRLDTETFTKCMMSLSASATYLDWLVGRNLTDRDRSPAFSRIKAIFAERLMQINGKKPLLPAPEWSHQKNAARGR